MQTHFWRASALGFAYGAMLYGLPVSLLHVAHNRLVSASDALVLAALCAGLYGAMAGVPTAGFAGALSLRRWLGGRRRVKSERRAVDWGLRLGLVSFTVLFWGAALLYGLTYQQTLLVRPERFGGMAIYLAVAGALVAVAAVVVALLVERFLSRARPGALAAALIGLPLLLLPAHVAVALGFAAMRADAAPVAGQALSEIRPVPGSPVLLVGFDGLDPEVVERLIGEGELPALAAAREEGVWGAMETLPDSNSAVIWATMYTGQVPREHGILDFFRIRLPGVRAELWPVHRTFFKELVGLLERFGLASRIAVTRSDLASVPIWEIADHFGIPIGVADGYLYSFPALEPETAGSWFLSYGLDTFAHLLWERQAEREDAALFVQPLDLLREPFGGGRLPREEDCAWQEGAVVKLLDSRPPPRLLSVYCHQPDTVQHEAWTRFEPWRYPPWRRPPAAMADDVDPITARHRQLDSFLARLLRRIGPETAVMVLSDHGHSPSVVHKLETQHRHGPPGAFFAFGGPFRRGHALGGATDGGPALPHVLDVAPTVLALLGLPIAADMPGRVLEELFAPGALPAAATIPTYEGLWQPKIRDVGRDRRLNEAEIEKLRGLGYIL
ncbi:MAG TPA: alkaline phosphatase family protein [Thermoanaerobaculia bacterium]|nr:alkaline phosphatase family protein [Thermoanaerobaculia bacterium]